MPRWYPWLPSKPWGFWLLQMSQMKSHYRNSWYPSYQSKTDSLSVTANAMLQIYTLATPEARASFLTNMLMGLHSAEPGNQRLVISSSTLKFTTYSSNVPFQFHFSFPLESQCVRLNHAQSRSGMPSSPLVKTYPSFRFHLKYYPQILSYFNVTSSPNFNHS